MEGNVGNWNILVPIGKESKTTIPKVVASEIGRAQTIDSNIYGVRITNKADL